MLQLATFSSVRCLPAENTHARAHTHTHTHTHIRTNTHGRAHSHTHASPLPHCSQEARRMVYRYSRAGQRSLSIHSRGKVIASPRPSLAPAAHRHGRVLWKNAVQESVDDVSRIQCRLGRAPIARAPLAVHAGCMHPLLVLSFSARLGRHSPPLAGALGPRTASHPG